MDNILKHFKVEAFLTYAFIIKIYIMIESKDHKLILVTSSIYIALLKSHIT